MFSFKEAKENIEFATHYRQLTKATADNETDTPGYIYEELYSLTCSHPQFNSQLVDFLISKLLNSGWYAKRKAVVVLLKLCRRGQDDLCRCLCKKDSELRKALSLSGQRGSINANQLQKDTNILLQELMQVIFSSEKGSNEIEGRGIEDKSKIVGYGSSKTSSRYDGFGTSHTEIPAAGLFDEFSQGVMSLFSTDEKRLKKDRDVEDILKPEAHTFKPLTKLSYSLQSSTSAARQSNKRTEAPMMSSSYRMKTHKPGRPGGGWASDDEDLSPMSAQDILQIDSSPKCDEEEETKYMQDILTEYRQWPIDNYLQFYSACKSSSGLNIPVFCKLVHRQLETCSNTIQSHSDEDSDKLMVLLLIIETTINLSIFPIPEARFRLLDLLSTVAENAIDSRVFNKAKKLCLTIEKLFELQSDAFDKVFTH